jgi:hypothetical protein
LEFTGQVAKDSVRSYFEPLGYIKTGALMLKKLIYRQPESQWTQLTSEERFTELQPQREQLVELKVEWIERAV